MKSTRILALFLAGLALLAINVHADGATLEEKVKEYRLKNGLRLLIVERPDSPTFAAHIAIGVGAVHETSRNRGVAHLLEHMLFKGTKTVGTTDYRRERRLLKEIEKVGEALDDLKFRSPGAGPETEELRRRLTVLQEQHKEFVVKDEAARIYAENGGVGFNAYTSRDLTAYIVSLPSNKLELWAFLESDRMKNAVFREFYTEREVVMEERRRSYDSDPQGLLVENLLAAAYTVHPYRNPIIGWESDIPFLTLSKTRQFHDKYYAPVNTVITLAGDVDADRAYRMVERYFGDIPSGTPVPPVVDVEPRQRGEKRIGIRFEAEPRIMIAFHKPTLPSREDYAFDLIDMILGDGPTSRLYRSLVVEKKLATSVATSTLPASRYPNLFVVSAAPRHPHTVDEVEQAVYEELSRLAAEPVGAAELDKVRNRLRVDRLRRLKSNKSLAGMLSYFQTVAGDWRYATRYDREIAGIGAEDVRRAAAAYLHRDNRTVAVVTRGVP
ncbi:MAG: insulinase family protein [Desulfuromonadaceae bacterium]|nr:insulinase family protein [Desulfuromonadaceae bacterium]